ncbi:hypothetical protein KCU87_g315, partial [Aureobasidium melanogenum]
MIALNAGSLLWKEKNDIAGVQDKQLVLTIKIHCVEHYGLYESRRRWTCLHSIKTRRKVQRYGNKGQPFARVHDGHTVVHCRCVHCGNDNTGGKPGEDGGQFGSSNPSLILFDVLALHATHWGHLLKIRRRGNEVPIEAGLRGPRMGARASAPVRQRAWCMPMPQAPVHILTFEVRAGAAAMRGYCSRR